MTDQPKNKVIELAEHPSGIPDTNTFRSKDIDIPEINDGEILLKSLYVSVDPGMRGFMNEDEGESKGHSFDIGDAITSRTVAEVVESQSPDFSAGDIVHGRLAWQKVQAISADELQIVDPERAPISTAISTLGVTGLAAYFGLTKIGAPQKGETLVVSGAAGAVGSVAAQIGKIMGCRVIGIAGSGKKIAYLEDELGIDQGINYNETDNMHAALLKVCPHGVDIFFDNVGGELFDKVFKLINWHARIVICGQIAEYNDDEPPRGPRPQHHLIKKSARMQGFNVFDFEDEFEEAKNKLAKWYNAGTLQHKETITEGFDKIPEAFIGLFSGKNIGKQLIKVGERMGH